MILPAPMDWVLREIPRATVRQPDLLVVPADTVNDKRITAPPRLVVEIISPDSQERDLVAKRRDYSRAGCPTSGSPIPSVRNSSCSSSMATGIARRHASKAPAG